MNSPEDSLLLSAPPRVRFADFCPFGPGDIIGPQWSESSLLLIILRGQGSVQVGRRHFSLAAEQILYVPWANPLRYSAHRKDPFAVIGIHFVHLPWGNPTPGLPPHFANKVDLKRGNYGAPPHPEFFTDAFTVNLPPRSSLPQIAIDIVETFERQPVNVVTRELRLRGLVLMLFADLCHCVESKNLEGTSSTASDSQKKLVREIANFMDTRMLAPHLMRRGSLARRAGVSESTLAAAFRAVTGQSPINYLIGLRIARAQRLLRSNRTTIYKVAKSVGIADGYYFSKLFKKRVGCSPLEYRKRLKF